MCVYVCERDRGGGGGGESAGDLTPAVLAVAVACAIMSLVWGHLKDSWILIEKNNPCSRGSMVSFLAIRMVLYHMSQSSLYPCHEQTYCPRNRVNGHK